LGTTTASVWKKAAKFMLIVFLLGWFRSTLEEYLGYYLMGFIYWVIVILIYIENAL
jgi:hypothetical protein